MTKTLYLIGGPMGVGKTTVCRELNQMLPWCWCADPFQVTPETKRMVLDNICHLLGNFLRCSTYENVILCWVMHERAIIEDILGRLPIEECGAEFRVVSLIAHEDELRRRIERDVRAGVRDEGAVVRSLSYLPRYRNLGTELIDTTSLAPHEVATRIVASDG